MLTFHSTVDSVAAIGTPLVGSGTLALILTSPANHFVPGITGNAVRFNSVDDHVRWQESDGATVNWPADRGSLEFWMKPRFADNNIEKLTFFQRRAWLAPGMLEFGKHNSSNANRLRLITIDAAGLRTDHEIDQAVWAAQLEYNAWSLVRATWDWSAAPGVQCCHVYANGVELPISKTSQGSTVLPGPLSGPQSWVPASAGEFFYYGSRGPGSQYRGNFDGDDIKLYDTP